MSIENQAFLALPWSVHYLTFLGRALLPVELFDWLNDAIGINNTYASHTPLLLFLLFSFRMDDFVGRKDVKH